MVECKQSRAQLREPEMADRAAAVKNLIVQAQKLDASGDEQVRQCFLTGRPFLRHVVG